jgi:hypothetical protein
VVPGVPAKVEMIPATDTSNTAEESPTYNLPAESPQMLYTVVRYVDVACT